MVGGPRGEDAQPVLVQAYSPIAHGTLLGSRRTTAIAEKGEHAAFPVYSGK